MEHSETSFSTIKSRLADLRTRDHRFLVFGSSDHKYEGVPDFMDDLVRLEKLFALRLPSAYQRFLFEIGCCAGAYYGILSLFGSESEINECFDPYYAEEAEALANLSLSSPFPTFPISDGAIFDHNRRFDFEESRLKFVADFPCNGCIPICRHGCAFYSVLITAGRLKGSVWDIQLDFGGNLWRPAKRPPGLLRNSVRLPRIASIPSFIEWYTSWLEQCEADLAPFRW